MTEKELFELNNGNLDFKVVVKNYLETEVAEEKDFYEKVSNLYVLARQEAIQKGLAGARIESDKFPVTNQTNGILFDFGQENPVQGLFFYNRFAKNLN